MTQTLTFEDLPRGCVAAGVDGSEASDVALAWAADSAARQHRTLVVIHTETPVFPWSASGYPSAMVDVAGQRDAALSGARSLTEAARDLALARHAELDVQVINDVIDPRVGLTLASQRAHEVVVGSRGRGPLTTMLLGSVSVSLSREASCPVIVVRPGQQTGSQVQALVDGTPGSVTVLEYAARHASETGQSLRISHLLWTMFDVNAQQIEEARRMLTEICAGLGEKFPDVDMVLKVDSVADPERLVTTTDDISLMVVGHHRTSRMHQFLYRSVSASIVEHASVPVAVVPILAN